MAYVKASPRDCLGCGETIVGGNGNSKRCKPCSKQHYGVWQKKKRRGPFECRWCSEEFYTTRTGQGDVYCSRSCYQKWKKSPDGRESTRAKTQEFYGIAATYRRHLSAGYRLLAPRQCEQCGSVFNPSSQDNVLCSVDCRTEQSRYEAWLRRRGRVVTCPTCNTEFCWLRGTDSVPIGKCAFCSDDCRSEAKAKERRIYRAKRRHKQRAGDCIDPIVVFENDGWSCQACGCSTPRELRGTLDDDAPEMDHIIALASGGTHTWDNVQCLCRVCNQLKSARDMTEFLDWNQGHTGAGVTLQSDIM